MKKKIMKALSVMLAVVLTLTAAPLSGFVGLELPEWLDFSIKSSATVPEGYETIVGTFESQTLVVGDNFWTTEITVDGESYTLDSDYAHDLDLTNNEEEYKNKDTLFVVHNNEVIFLDTIDDIKAGKSTISVQPSVGLYGVELEYKNGKFTSKKIDISGTIEINTNLGYVDNFILSSYHLLGLENCKLTLKSSDKDIIYFKESLLSSKSDSITVDVVDTLISGASVIFSQKAYVNTSWDFPDNTEVHSVSIICEYTGTSNGKSVSDSTTLNISFTNENDNSQGNTSSSWRKQSLTQLVNQMKSEVNNCPVLTGTEKIELAAIFASINVSERLLELNEELSVLETVYDLGCYAYGLKQTTINTAGKVLIETIANECDTSSDELKKELANLFESLTNSATFNKFAYWYYNDYQVQIGNMKRVDAHCPIDVSVIDEDGLQVVSVVDDVVLLSDEGTAAFVCESEKTIFLPTDINYTVKITATDNGTMNYTVCEYTPEGYERTVEYHAVELVEGKIYTSQITRESLPTADSYNLITDSGEEISSDFDSHSEDAYVTGICGENVTWVFNQNSGVLNISGAGAMKDFSSGDCPWDDYEDEIKQIIIDSGVTTIGDYSFAFCNNLVSIIIPNSIIEIGSSAFRSSSGFDSIIIPGSVKSIGENAFTRCSLTNVVFDSGVISIDNYAFAYCINLTNVEIPDSVITVGEHAFDTCTNLTDVVIGDGVTSIGGAAFANCVNITDVKIGDNVTSLGASAFWDCDNLVNVVIPDSVTTIGDYAFAGCDSLTNVTIGNNVTTIGVNAFGGCGITTLAIPENVTTIGDDAFNSCSSLTSVYVKDITNWCRIDFGSSYSNPMCYADNLYVNGEILEGEVIIPQGVSTIPYGTFKNSNITSATISDGVSTIGGDAFSNCEHLKSIEISDSVTKIYSGAFNSCESLEIIYITDIANWCNIYFADIYSNPLYYADVFCVNGKEITELIIPEGTGQISNYAFSQYGNLQSVTIPDSVTTIGNYAFSNCDNLESIEIPDSVITIGEWAFSNCDALTNIIIGDSVKTIMVAAFANNYSITNVYYSGMEEQWNETTIEYGNDYLTNATIHYNASVNNINYPTCTKSGTITYNCSCCGETIKEIPATGHNYQNGVCAECGLSETHSHEYTSNITKEPSCFEEGIRTYTCTCGYSYTETIPTIAHSYTSSNITKEPSCSEEGVRTYTCTCGYSYTEVIPTLAHSYTEWVTTVEPTCTATGIKTRTCSYCGNEEINDISKKGHTYEDVYDEISGTNISKCKNCGDIENNNSNQPTITISANSTNVNIGDTVKVTVTLGAESGLGTLTIKANYDTTVFKAVKMESGDLGAKVNVKTGIAAMATAGTYETEGTVCIITLEALNAGSTVVAFDVLEAVDNDFNSVTVERNEVEIMVTEPSTSHSVKVVTIPATCTVAGMTYNVCEICGETIGDSIVIPATGHTTGGWEVVLTPTYEANGKQVKKCTGCGEIVAEETIPMLVKVTVTDEKTGISMDYDKDSYSGDVEIIVKEFFDGTTFDVIDTSLNASQKFIYDISMTVDGVATQPIGSVTIRIPLQAGYDPSRSFVYHIDTETGKVEKMPATYEDGYLVFETTHFSYYAVVEEANYTFSIQNPSRTEIRNKDGIILHAIVEGNAPNGSYVKWESSNGYFDTNADGSNLKIIAKNKGYTTFTAILCDADGNELARDTVEMYSKSGFFDKIGGFFRSLFGTTKIYDN